ncbi:hypothetical protein SUGI_0293880 [Cryptomeria japonica]|nr:hypothetical protein SUGI_0293880 [Cryptomeria japonica]
MTYQPQSEDVLFSLIGLLPTYTSKSKKGHILAFTILSDIPNAKINRPTKMGPPLLYKHHVMFLSGIVVFLHGANFFFNSVRKRALYRNLSFLGYVG